MALTDQDIQKINEVLSPKFDSLSDAIESLAITTKKGFDNVVSKTEFNEFRDEMYEFKKETTAALSSLDSKLYDIDNRLKKVEETLEPLLTGYRIMQNEISDLNKRIEKLELKVGIA